MKGSGTLEAGLEWPRIRVTLATGIPRALCERVNLGYAEPQAIRRDDWRDREAAETDN